MFRTKSALELYQKTYSGDRKFLSITLILSMFLILVRSEGFLQPTYSVHDTVQCCDSLIKEL